MRFFLLLFGLLLALPGLGQPAEAVLPPGGYPLRQVPAIQPTVQEGRRLVSYRKGDLYGYADTTGTLVVAPAATDRLPFFKDGLGRTNARVVPALARLPVPKKLSNKVLFNARGEYLLVRYDEYAAPGPDGRWQTYPRPAATRRQHLTDEIIRWEYAFLNYAEAKDWLYYYQKSHSPKGSLRTETKPLGPNCSAFNLVYKEVDASYSKEVAAHYSRHGRCSLSPPALYLRSNLALMDSTGHQLTKLTYSDLSHYSERRLWYATKGRYDVPGQDIDSDSLPHGVLDTRGHRLTAARFDGFSAFRHGVATVRLRRGAHRWLAGIIDSLGHYTMRPQPEPLSRTDEAGLVRRLHQTSSGQPVVQFLTRYGQPAFAHYELSDAGPVWGGRAWARVGSQQGLLDAAGRWVVPCQYSGLWYSYYQKATSPDERRVDNNFEATMPAYLDSYDTYAERYYYTRPDTAFLVCQRAGRYGLVSRHTGQEVVPCRYDSVLAACNGYGSFRREGHIYFVGPEGRELAQGCFEGETYDFPQGRFFKIYSDYLDQRIGSRHQGPRSWTVISAQGQQMLPWLATPGDYLPEGGALLAGGTAACGCMAPCASIIDATGLLLYQAPGRLSYGLNSSGDHHFFGKQNYAAAVVHRPPPRVFWHEVATDTVELLNYQFQLITGQRYTSMELAAPGWYVGNSYSKTQTPGSALFTAAGHRYVLTGDSSWSVNAFWDAASPFNELGVVFTTRGYVTKGGRHLWDE